MLIFTVRYGINDTVMNRDDDMEHFNREIEILTKHGYSKEAVAGIKRLEKMIDDDSELSSETDRIVYDYAASGKTGLEEALRRMRQACAARGIHEYSSDLLLVINGLPYLHEKYKAAGIPDEVFFDTMDDIRCKVNECIECKGIVGTFVAVWYEVFYTMRCFSYGRFQYENVIHDGEDIKLSCGKVLKNGGRYINIHIPSNGIPLTDGVRMESYRKAYPHVAHMFGDGIVIFGCFSWLLFDKHRIFLPKDMNIRRFMDDFEMISVHETEKFDDAWRVFGKYADLPANEYPTDTRLRAAYAKWLSDGNGTGEGFGLFAFDGEKILR